MNKYNLMALTGFILWVTSTIYFGMNKTPQSSAEVFTDTLSVILVFWGIIGDLLTNIKIVKNYYYKINKYEQTKQTRTRSS